MLIAVNDNDESTLPPMDKVVWIYYPSGYDGGSIVQLGGRTEDGDGERLGWGWGVLDSSYLGRNWEPKLCGLEIDDDYDVTHWAEIEWPATTTGEGG